MANPDARFGLRPVRHVNGAPWNGATIRCYISADYATALFIGDPVDFETTAANIPTTSRCPSVIRAAGVKTTYILGVITSFEPDPDNLTLQYRKANTARYCNVCIARDVVFQIRDNGAAVLTKTVMGANADGIHTHAGNTITGLSGFELDAGTTTAPAADATYSFVVLSLADVEDNEFDGTTTTHMIWEVVVNMDRLKVTTSAALGVLAA